MELSQYLKYKMYITLNKFLFMQVLFKILQNEILFI